METVNISCVYEITIRLLSLLNIAGQGLCLSYFLHEFLKEKYFSPIFTAILTAIIYTVFRLCAEEWIPQYSVLRTFGRLFLSILSITFIIRLLYSSNIRIALFLMITFISLSEISLFIAYTLLYFGGNISHFWVWCMDRGYFSSTEHFLHAVEGSLSLLLFFQQIILLALLFFSLKKIVKEFQAKELPIHSAELRFLLFPVLTGLFFCLMLRLIMLPSGDDTRQLLYQEYPLLALLVPVIMLFSLFSILSGIRLFQEMRSRQQEKSSRILLEQQICNLQKQTGEMEEHYSELRRLRHDMKNILSVFMQLTRDNITDSRMDPEVERYLAQLALNLDSLQEEFSTGNTVADTLLRMKQYEISCWNNELLIDAEELLFPAQLKIESYDLAIILGNALDNAIEACRLLWDNSGNASLFIKVSSFQKNGLFFLEIINSFDGKINWDSSREFPQSSKADKSVHGIGLLNMKATAQKYDGEVDWFAQGEVFRLTVMMKG